MTSYVSRSQNVQIAKCPDRKIFRYLLLSESETYIYYNEDSLIMTSCISISQNVHIAKFRDIYFCHKQKLIFTIMIILSS